MTKEEQDQKRWAATQKVFKENGVWLMLYHYAYKGINR